MKTQLEKGKTRTKIQNEQQPHGFISISSRNLYQKLSYTWNSKNYSNRNKIALEE